MTSQQLKFGAYWDAIPPFYSVQGLPPIQESNYEEFTDGSRLMPVQMPRDLVFKLLWQVRSVTLKLEYDFDPKDEDGWTSLVTGTTTSQPSVLETKGPFVLQNAAIGAMTSRELRIPQGYISHLTSEPYPIDKDETRDLAREGFGIINPFIASEYADFTQDQALLIPAIDAEATAIKARLATMKTLADASDYVVLKDEIERQETSFDAAVNAIKQKYQAKLDLIAADYNAGSASESNKTFYGKKAQQEKDQAVYEVKQEAQLQWFDWEGGFGRQVRFGGVGKYRVQAPRALHFPPTIAGLFAGVYQTTDQMQALSSDCIAVLSTPLFQFRELRFSFNQEFQYDRNVLIQPEEPEVISVDGFLLVDAVVDPFKVFSTDQPRAAALKVESAGDADLFGGYYEEPVDEGPPLVYFVFTNYASLFNEYTENQRAPLPGFPQESAFPTQEIADVVLSGDYFGAGDYSAAVQKLQPIADKIRELKEVGAATENGAIEFRGKDNALLFEAPIFVKNAVPIKNVRLTYKIDKLYTDPA
jgi:hypothetical protein